MSDLSLKRKGDTPTLCVGTCSEEFSKRIARKPRALYARLHLPEASA
jgi:hypothetical protein